MKHSPNLAKFLKAADNVHYQKVYLLKTDLHGMPVTDWKPSAIMIGFADDFGIMGARLSHILCGNFKTWANPFSPESYTDITVDFFAQYEQDGRCAVDRSHMKYFRLADDRFTENGDTRTCNWCGQVHSKSTHDVITKEIEVVWTPVRHGLDRTTSGAIGQP